MTEHGGISAEQVVPSTGEVVMCRARWFRPVRVSAPLLALVRISEAVAQVAREATERREHSHAVGGQWQQVCTCGADFAYMPHLWCEIVCQTSFTRNGIRFRYAR